MLFRVENLSVRVNDKLVVNNISKEIDSGQIHVILGANGSGKSSFAKGVLNSFLYDVKGLVYFNDEDISELETYERARLGIFVSFQNPHEIESIKNANFLRQSMISNSMNMSSKIFKDEFIKSLKEVGLSEEFFDRSLNFGFSGGEKKKNELAQMIMLKPKLVILDEIDSGMDVDSTKKTARIISNMAKDGTAFFIITHSKEMIKNLSVDKVYLYKNGQIVKTGDKSLLKHLDSGYLDE